MRDSTDWTNGSTTRKGWAIALLSLASFVSTLDTSIVIVALPAIGRDLGLSAGRLHWVLVSYSLALGGLVLLGGRASDLFGRRRLFLLGLALFASASAVGALAVAPWMLLAARVAQGIGAAAFTPASLAFVTSIFKEGRERERAVGIYSAMGALGFATGLALSGAITELLGWRWVVFSPAPIAMFMLLLTPSVIPEHREPRERTDLDLWGAVTATLGLATLIYALPEAADKGWASPTTVGLLALGLTLIAVFVVIEHLSSAPLVPLSTFRSRSITVANAVTVLRSTAEITPYVLTLYAQQVLGYSPLEAGMIQIPPAVAGAVAAPAAGRLVNRLGGVRPTMVLGMLILMAGLLLMALMMTGNGIALVALGAVIAAAGKVIAHVATTITGTSDPSEDRKGLAAGLLSTSLQLGAAFGLGMVGAIVSARTSALGGEATGSETLIGGLRTGLLVSTAFVALALSIAVAGLSTQRLHGGRTIRDPIRR
jgi:EmrB/QacA subfamily drug resistance transporter